MKKVKVRKNTELRLGQVIDHDSLIQLADRLVKETKVLLQYAKTEEDLRIGFEKLLEPIKADLNLTLTTHYEKSVYRGRPDALHGQLVIEYEPPGAFKSRTKIDHAFLQLINYIQELSKKETLFLFDPKYVGVGFDGEKIFFVRYIGDRTKAKEQFTPEDFTILGPYEFTPESARTFLMYLRALARLPLNAENLAQRFGPSSELAPKMVSALVNALKHWGEQERIRTFFNEWKRLFGIVYGEVLTSGVQDREMRALSEVYKVREEVDFQELLFCVHTYFVFLMKLISAEILVLKETSLATSLAFRLAHSSDDELKRELEDIEDGGIYARKGITNFLEGDFFRWYLDAFDSPELKDAIREVSRSLAEFEPATSSLEPSATRDLLKKLYQYLVPREVRHRLGEYYTPDWLAELLLKEVGYDGNNFKRFLDPACGSGTFLVLAIQKAIDWGKKNKRPRLEIAKSIVANIWGFDLNPLAVIAARTNYLFALGDLADELTEFEIPIYLADSILWPEHTGIKGALRMNLYGEQMLVKTSARDFHVPLIWIKDKGCLMKEAAPLIEKFVKNGFEPEVALKHLKKKGLVFPPHETSVAEFYNEILKLEKERKNGIWARFLKNVFAPMVAGKFDFVVGNPPWVMWQYLSREYREATKNLWDSYGLSIIKESKDKLSKGKKDFSMLFVYASADYYLQDGGKLGFLITQEVFKSKGAGEGFRRFRLGEGKYLKVLKAHDLVSIQPFEGAANKTAAIILKKGEKTEYPLPYFIWTKKKGVGKIPTDKLLDEVLKLVYRKRMLARPISSDVSAWQSFEVENVFSKIIGTNQYRAKIGARTEPYGIFWIKIMTLTQDGNLLIKNITEGRRKKQIFEKEAKIESNFIYPSFRGSDINRWNSSVGIYTLILNDPANPNKPFKEEDMKLKFPLTYNYLTHFKTNLLERAAYKKFHCQAGRPFYTQFNISRDTFMNYKVVWKRMTNDIFACVLSQVKTPFGFKMAIPLDTTSFFATNNEAEAHYLCAIVNSTPVRDFIKSFSSAGRGFGTPSVMEHIGIPKFDPKNPIHKKLAEISKRCHQLKAEGKENELLVLEKQNDEAVKELFGIK
ncbi:N-6 DNA methylase [candidate division WOR-3 bacterium]|nr:N-6 DNA methylase [candidate division WOR-3 bacterium]